MIHVPDYKLEPDEAPIHCICEICGGDIYIGEDYYHIDQIDVYDDCIWEYVREYRRTAE